MHISFKIQLLTLAVFVCFSAASAQHRNAIQPGEVWPDTDGKHIQAHGEGIIRIGKIY